MPAPHCRNGICLFGLLLVNESQFGEVQMKPLKVWSQDILIPDFSTPGLKKFMFKNFVVINVMVKNSGIEKFRARAWD